MSWSPTGAKRASVPLFATALAAALVAVAAPSPAQAAGALVIKNGGTCTLLDGSGAVVSLGKGRAVVNRPGKGLWKCRGKVAAPASGKAVQFTGKKSGLTCTSPAGSTKNWHETVSASGRATLTCHVR